MKGIFFCEGIELDKADKLGIERKVLLQIESLKKIGELTVIDIKLDKNDKLDKIKFILPIIKSKRELNREIILEKVDETIDYIYIRKPSLTYNFYKLLLEIKKKNPQIYIMLEIPTFPFHSEYIGFKKIMALKSFFCEICLKKVIDKIITYSDDDIIWKIPTIKMSNCVSYTSIPPRTEKYKIKKDTIRLTCVAKFMYWHGMDRLINGINEYNGKYKIIFNVVGDGEEIENLKKLSKDNKNIIFHGLQSGEMLNQIFDQTDIAVDALGRHRSGVYYNSSLKGKEYAARGIPVISAVRTELDYMPDFKYYLKFPSDESYIDINQIICFYEKIYLNNDSIEITNKIRNSTEKIFDYKYGFEDKIRTQLNLKEGSI